MEHLENSEPNFMYTIKWNSLRRSTIFFRCPVYPSSLSLTSISIRFTKSRPILSFLSFAVITFRSILPNFRQQTEISSSWPIIYVT